MRATYVPSSLRQSTARCLGGRAHDDSSSDSSPLVQQGTSISIDVPGVVQNIARPRPSGCTYDGIGNVPQRLSTFTSSTDELFDSTEIVLSDTRYLIQFVSGTSDITQLVRQESCIACFGCSHTSTRTMVDCATAHSSFDKPGFAQWELDIIAFGR